MERRQIPRPPNLTGIEVEQAKMHKALTAWIAGDKKAKTDLILSISSSELKQVIVKHHKKSGESSNQFTHCPDQPER